MILGEMVVLRQRLLIQMQVVEEEEVLLDLMVVLVEEVTLRGRRHLEPEGLPDLLRLQEGAVEEELDVALVQEEAVEEEDIAAQPH